MKRFSMLIISRVVVVCLIFYITVLVPGNECSATDIIFPAQSASSPKFWTDISFYKGQEGFTQLEVYYSLPARELKFDNQSGEYRALYAFSVTVKNSDNQIVFDKSIRKQMRVNTPDEINDERRGVIDQMVFDLQPDDYAVEIDVNDEFGERKSSISGHLQVPAFSDALTLSTLQLASLISSDLSQPSFVKGNKVVIPNTSRKYRSGKSLLYLYFEVYNLSAPKDSTDKNFEISYCITNEAGDSLIYFPGQTITKPGTSCMKTQTLDVRGLPAGEYTIDLGVSDLSSDQWASRQKRFWIYEPPLVRQKLSMTEADRKKYRDQIKYFATDQELQVFDMLEADGTEEFLVNFWRSRDTTPETPENEFMLDCFSRMAYANEKFKGIRGGLNSDMGRIFAVYGQPDEIDDHSMDMNSKPYIVWHYFNTGTGRHLFAFIDESSDGIYILVHSTVETEINNTNWMSQVMQ